MGMKQKIYCFIPMKILTKDSMDFDDYPGFQQIPSMPILLQQSVCTSFILPIARAEVLHTYLLESLYL